METPVIELINQIASQGLPAEGTDMSAPIEY